MKLLLFPLLLLLPLVGICQKTNKTECIIVLESTDSKAVVLTELTKQYPMSRIKCVSSHFRTYLMDIPKQKSIDLQKIRSIPGIKSAMLNQQVDFRYEPNDELYSEQWAIPRLHFNQVWNEAKGDVTPQGHEIVVAIFDDGFRSAHPDLQAQLYQNPHEIPNDGIDNDDNGYVDDTHGINVKTNNSEHESGMHGSPVAGILGATVDNQQGVAGAAYNTRLLPITATYESIDVIEGFAYVYRMRKRYNETQGAEGAFIVAANLSIGLDNQFPMDVEPWCSWHDSLGSVGILSVGSVTNAKVNVAETGDIPTLCPSEYLISVTQTDIDDRFPPHEGGYGATHVDLAAPGDKIMTTANNDNYRSFDGCSASAPFVSAAIASLYSAPCDLLSENALSNPAQTAREIKQILLASVDPLPDLQGITVSEGRLNVLQAMQQVQKVCDISSAPFSIIDLSPNPTDGVFRIRYTLDEYYPIDVKLHNATGRLMQQDRVQPQIFGERSIELNIQDRLPAGLYFVSLEQKGQRITRKLVIQ